MLTPDVALGTYEHDLGHLHAVEHDGACRDFREIASGSSNSSSFVVDVAPTTMRGSLQQASGG